MEGSRLGITPNLTQYLRAPLERRLLRRETRTDIEGAQQLQTRRLSRLPDGPANNVNVTIFKNTGRGVDSVVCFVRMITPAGPTVH